MFNKLILDNKFNDVYAKISKNSMSANTEAKTTIEEQYNFTIDEQVPVKVITQNDGLVTYQMLIHRTLESTLQFENLVVKTNAIETKAAIIEYNLNQSPIDAADESRAIDINSQIITPLTVGGKFGTFEDWIIILVVMCDNNGSGGTGIPHPAGNNCLTSEHIYTVTIWWSFKRINRTIKYKWFIHRTFTTTFYWHRLWMGKYNSYRSK